MCPFCYHNGGSLLHCLSTLTFLKKAVYFCCTGLGVTSTGRYPASCPVKPGLSSSAPFRLYSRDHLTCLRKCYFNTIFPLSKGFYFTVIRHFTVLLPDFTVIFAFPVVFPAVSTARAPSDTLPSRLLPYSILPQVPTVHK